MRTIIFYLIFSLIGFKTIAQKESIVKFDSAKHTTVNVQQVGNDTSKMKSLVDFRKADSANIKVNQKDTSLTTISQTSSKFSLFLNNIYIIIAIIGGLLGIILSWRKIKKRREAK